MNNEVKGKCGISAKIILDSTDGKGNRLTTFEIEYPRIVLSEYNTHRALSKNSASSRAIPFTKMQEQLTGRPVRFGAANKGMQDGGEHAELINGLYTPEEWWNLAKLSAINFAKGFQEAGYAKQVYNRLTECFQMMKTVVSATEIDNFFWLRDHAAADPTIEELARCMKEAREQSQPQVLKPGEWHLPFVEYHKGCYFIYDEHGNEVPLELEQAIKVSCARACAVSFRNTDYGLEKSKEVFARLVGDDRKHASALEHAAKVMEPEDHDYLSWRIFGVNDPMAPDTWEKGISHVDRDSNLWSGNFKGFIQFRKTIDGENYKENKVD